KREKKVKDIPFDLPRPEKAVIFPNRFLFLLEDRFKEEYAKGRKAFVDLLGSVYDPQRPKLMISLPDMDELVRNNLARSENLHSLNQFRRKYFPNMKSLSKMISKLCWEEIEFDVEQNALRLVTDPIEFKKNLEVQLAYRRQLLDSIDRQLLSFKDKYPEEPMKYKPVTNQKQRSPLRRTYRGCDTSSEDDMTRRYRPFTKSELGTDNEHEIEENLVTKSEKTESNALVSTTESHPQHPSYKTKG
uniref:Ycf1 n=1 Tax=Panagrolaimus sp. JU765 TaxID=591449 RepID=A0AC34RDZ1_9BILA